MQVNDIGYIDKPEAVWELLDDIDGNTLLMDASTFKFTYENRIFLIIFILFKYEITYKKTHDMNANHYILLSFFINATLIPSHLQKNDE